MFLHHVYLTLWFNIKQETIHGSQSLYSFFYLFEMQAMVY